MVRCPTPSMAQYSSGSPEVRKVPTSQRDCRDLLQDHLCTFVVDYKTNGIFLVLNGIDDTPRSAGFNDGFYAWILNLTLDAQAGFITTTGELTHVGKLLLSVKTRSCLQWQHLMDLTHQLWIALLDIMSFFLLRRMSVHQSPHSPCCLRRDPAAGQG